MDILNLVVLTPVAVSTYQHFAQQAATVLAELGALESPEQIPEEQGTEQPDGSLLVWVDLPSKLVPRLEFKIPKGQWAWKDRN